MKKFIAIILLFVTVFTSGCSVIRTKDLTAYTNLLVNMSNYRLSDNGYDASLIAEGDGIKVTAKASGKDGGWLVLMYYDGQTRNLLAEGTGDKYTIVFEVKSNVAGVRIPVSHRQGDGKEMQIDFGTAEIGKANIWEQIILTGELLGVPAASQGIYFNLSFIPANTDIFIRNLKLIKGAI